MMLHICDDFVVQNQIKFITESSVEAWKKYRKLHGKNMTRLVFILCEIVDKSKFLHIYIENCITFSFTTVDNFS